MREDIVTSGNWHLTIGNQQVEVHKKEQQQQEGKG
jgi:hypothetical protein